MNQAKYVECPNMQGQDGKQFHTNLDFCGICAPYWEQIPLCPVHGKKLHQSNKEKGWCKECRKYYLFPKVEGRLVGVNN